MSEPDFPRLARPASPQALYGPLFEAVQLGGLFADSKTFVDATPRASAAAILHAYAGDSRRAGFDLGRFVAQWFELPPPPADTGPEPGLSVAAHVAALWPHLQRSASAATPDERAEAPAGSLLPLPHPYVVPGGRFREVYYWDSFFTMQALALQGLRPLAQGMLDNFAALVRGFGHVPNSNRSYMLSRSQPPLLYRMVELLAPADPAPYLDVLCAEHRFWMAGADALAPGDAHRRVVRLADGTLLNRYWDDSDRPRDESYREDIETAAAAPRRPAAEVWRELRAGAESGWDFSSRWCAEPDRLETIETSAILPIDLNALLWGLETAIARAAYQQGDATLAARFDFAAGARAAGIRRHLWNSAEACFVDLQWRRGVRRSLSAATVVPLYTGFARADEASALAATLEARLLGPNGLRTTLVRSGQQWDQPNGWAPLQLMAVEGLLRYGHDALALELARRWLGCLERVHAASGKLVEKYDTEVDRPGGGGEYPAQDGFGWSNASYVVLQALVAGRR